MIKKLLSIILAMSILFLCSFSTLAIDSVESHIFIDEEGNEIVYYIDGENIPFSLVDGEKIYIALGLPEYEVKDSLIVSELNEQRLSENNNARSEPTDFCDLSGCANTSNSSSYIVNASGLGDSYFNTRVLKYNTSHKAIAIKTSSHKPIFCDEEVNIIYYYYHNKNEKWYSYVFMNKDCSVLGGFRFLHSPSLYQYGKVGIIAHSTLTSCKLEIFTTPYATGPSIPNIT